MSNSNDDVIIGDFSVDTQVNNPVEKVTGRVTYDNDVKSSNTNTEFSSSNSKTNCELTRDSIMSLGDLIHLVDSDEKNNLDMFCYTKCSGTDNDIIKGCRGVVFNGNELVMKAFPYTDEYNHTEVDDITHVIGDIKDWTFFEAHEGALIRMFYFNGKWFLSTHRKLDAFRSKWASRESFGKLFETALISEYEVNETFRKGLPSGDNILEQFQSTLDINKQYMFLVRNNKDNRIVCDPPERPIVFHVGTFVNRKLVMTENVNLPVPNKLVIKNIDQLISHVRTSSYRILQGVIGFTSDNRQVKIVHQDYQDLFKARGNEPSIKFRYLQVRMNRKYVNMLFHLYPEMTDIFDMYENTLYDIARSIYRAYVQRFIKKRYVTTPREEFAVIRECHNWHLSNRTENRISVNKVIDVMNHQPPTNLNHMMRRFKLEQNRQKEQLIARPRTDSTHSTRSFEKSPMIRKINVIKPVSPLILSQNTTLKS